MNMRLLVILSFAFVSAAAVAAGPTDVGKTTKEALAMQRDGEQAAPLRPMLKDTADQVYQRYLESFTHPIPERFESRDSFSSGR